MGSYANGLLPFAGAHLRKCAPKAKILVYCTPWLYGSYLFVSVISENRFVCEDV
jgi:hypothetical protein